MKYLFSIIVGANEVHFTDIAASLFNFALNINWMAQSGWKFKKIYAKPYLKQ